MDDSHAQRKTNLFPQKVMLFIWEIDKRSLIALNEMYVRFMRFNINSESDDLSYKCLNARFWVYF